MNKKSNGRILGDGLDIVQEGLFPYVENMLKQAWGDQWFSNEKVEGVFPKSCDTRLKTPPFDLYYTLKIIKANWNVFKEDLGKDSAFRYNALYSLRNDYIHNPGVLYPEDYVLEQLCVMELVLKTIHDVNGLSRIQTLKRTVSPRLRDRIRNVATFKSKYAWLWWLVTITGIISAASLIDFLRSPRLQVSKLVIGTPDRSLKKYIALENELEKRLRPDKFTDYLFRKQIDVSLENAGSYPKAISSLQELKWDIVMAYSPIVSIAALEQGYKGIGLMFADRPGYNSVLFTRRSSKIFSINDLSLASRIALGDYFSASKYFAPMDMLKDQRVLIAPGNSTSEIKEMVSQGKADAGALSRNIKNPQKSVEYNTSDNIRFRVIAQSPPLPETIVGLSPRLSDGDRDVIARLMLSLPLEVRQYDAANYGEGKTPDYEDLIKKISGVSALATCIKNQESVFVVQCPPDWIPVRIDAWITDVFLDGDRVALSASTNAPGKIIKLIVGRNILDKTAPVGSLFELKGRRVQLLTSASQADNKVFQISHPHQLSF